VNSTRRIALVAGVLFLLTFVTAIVGVVAYGPVLTDPNYVSGAGGADTRVLLGAFMELLLIVANIGTAVALFPILKRQHEGLALGYVTARLVECTFILVGIVTLLAILTLRQGAASADAGSLVPVGKALVAIHNWTFLLGPGFVAGLGNGLLLGYLMCRSGLVPRRMTLLGLIGGPLLAASGIAILFGLFASGSAWQGIATIPEFLWEAFLGLWLTFKGFNPSALGARETPEVRTGAGSSIDAVVTA